MATLTASHATASRTHLLTAGFLMVAMAVVVGTALGFEHLGGYLPCKLCLEQRIPYYVGVPLMAVTLLTAAIGLPAWITRLLLLAGAVLMVYSLYLGVHHAGVEWGWWAGPTDCGAVEPPASGDSGNGVLDLLDKVVPPSCDKASLRVLGLSFAGWNAVASFVLALVALRGAAKRA
jgi:disulfide bond formation protein DsbB